MRSGGINERSPCGITEGLLAFGKGVYGTVTGAVPETVLLSGLV